jgi:hypothetical protein
MTLMVLSSVRETSAPTTYSASKSSYITTLMDRCNILCLHEHWLPDAQLCELSCICKDILCTGVCGVNGCTILWHYALALRVNYIILSSNRICVVSLCGVN